jgi:hypothetical protein
MAAKCHTIIMASIRSYPHQAGASSAKNQHDTNLTTDLPQRAQARRVDIDEHGFF